MHLQSVSNTDRAEELEFGGHREHVALLNANVVIGESRLTAAPFFEGAGRPSVPFWGPQQGRRVILWESLSPEDQQKCLNDLQDNKEWDL